MKPLVAIKRLGCEALRRLGQPTAHGVATAARTMSGLAAINKVFERFILPLLEFRLSLHIPVHRPGTAVNLGTFPVAEVNNGGDLVENTLKQVWKGTLPLRKIHAKRDKFARAEPVERHCRPSAGMDPMDVMDCMDSMDTAKSAPPLPPTPGLRRAGRTRACAKPSVGRPHSRSARRHRRACPGGAMTVHYVRSLTPSRHP